MHHFAVGGRFWITISCGLLIFASLARPVAAAEFIVNSTDDLPDNNPGNGTCADMGGACTLRAAIEETNALPGMDVITLPAGTFPIDSQLVIDDSLFINSAGMG